MTFSFSLLGTFLVRSGVLTSVHSFASDPTRGMVILSLLAAFIGGAFTLFAMRASSLRQGGLFSPISKEGSLVLNNLFLATGLGAVLVGTLYPLVLDALTGRTISVGEPFFNLTFGTLMVPLLILVPFGPFLAWKRGDLIAVTQRLAGVAALALLVVIVIFMLSGAHISLAPLGLLLGFWVMFGAIAELVDRSKLGRIPLGESWRRLKGLPRTAFSTALGHFGLGLTVIGIVVTTAWQSELITTVGAGETITLDGYQIRLDRLDEDVPGPNYKADHGEFVITAPGGGTRQAVAERRYYVASGEPTTEAAIQTYGFSQLYLQLGEDEANGRHVVRVWYKPFVTFIWLGCLIMAGAGFVSLSDRRLRVGAPKPRRSAVAGAAE